MIGNRFSKENSQIADIISLRKTAVGNKGNPGAMPPVVYRRKK